MKMTKKALIATAALILSSQVFASDTHQTSRVIQTADMDTKVAAYELALDKLETIKNDSSVELNNELRLVASSASLNEGSYITVTEKMDANGDMLYTGLVNVSVTYSDLN